MARRLALKDEANVAVQRAIHPQNRVVVVD
jgi:hypothetical protein